MISKKNPVDFPIISKDIHQYVRESGSLVYLRIDGPVRSAFNFIISLTRTFVDTERFIDFSRFDMIKEMVALQKSFDNLQTSIDVKNDILPYSESEGLYTELEFFNFSQDYSLIDNPFASPVIGLRSYDNDFNERRSGIYEFLAESSKRYPDLAFRVTEFLPKRFERHVISDCIYQYRIIGENVDKDVLSAVSSDTFIITEPTNEEKIEMFSSTLLTKKEIEYILNYRASQKVEDVKDAVFSSGEDDEIHPIEDFNSKDFLLVDAGFVYIEECLARSVSILATEEECLGHDKRMPEINNNNCLSYYLFGLSVAASTMVSERECNELSNMVLNIVADYFEQNNIDPEDIQDKALNSFYEYVATMHPDSDVATSFFKRFNSSPSDLLFCRIERWLKLNTSEYEDALPIARWFTDNGTDKECIFRYWKTNFLTFRFPKVQKWR